MSKRVTHQTDSSRHIRVSPKMVNLTRMSLMPPLVLLAVFCLVVPVTTADDSSATAHVEFPSGFLGPSDALNTEQLRNLVNKQQQHVRSRPDGDSSHATMQWFVQMDGTLSNEQMHELKRTVGGHMVRYAPVDAFLWVGDAEVALAAAEHPLVAAVYPRRAVHRLNRKLAAEVVRRADDVSGGWNQHTPMNISEDRGYWVTLLPTDAVPSRRHAATIGENMVAALKACSPTNGDVPTTVRTDEMDFADKVLIASHDKICIPATTAHCLMNLAAMDEIDHIEPAPRRERRNFASVKVLTSGNSASLTQAWANNAAWDMGLTGAGQIVGASDTGIDPDNCYFWNQGTSGHPSSNQVITSRRKVIANFQYRGASCGLSSNRRCGDNYDDYVGHGTHVAGSLAGYPAAPPPQQADVEAAKKYSSAAKDAKIAYTDISDTQTEELTPPVDLKSGLFPDPYNAGARVHTNSWGSDDPTYNSAAAELDKFVSDHPDFLVLWAGGNTGPGPGTIGEPATCKNCIAVGASEVSWQKVVDTVSLYDPDEACYGGWSNCCTNYQCKLSQCCSIDSGAACCLSSYNQQHSTRGNLASWSSRGPTSPASFGRFKPDVVVPGVNIISAKSDGKPNTNGVGSAQCGQPVDANSRYTGNVAAVAMTGTSMASPVLAGIVTLVRQYFTDGFYQSGTSSSGRRNAPVAPSAALLKAMIIASAFPLTGTDRGMPMGGAPNFHYGFGQPDTSTVLKKASSSFNLWIDDSSRLAQGSATTYVISGCRATAAAPLRIALVWSDVAASAGAQDALVNDIDLKVSLGGELHYGNGRSTFDRVNNVERVWIESVIGANNVATVTVKAHRVPSGTASYAIVVAGSFASVCSNCAAPTTNPSQTDHVVTENVITQPPSTPPQAVSSGASTPPPSANCGDITCVGGTCTVGGNGRGLCTCLVNYFGENCDIFVTPTKFNSATVSQATGGEVALPSGDAITFPQGVLLGTSIDVVFSELPQGSLPTARDPGVELRGTVKDLRPDGARFASEVTLSLQIGNSPIPRGHRAYVAWFSPRLSRWEVLDDSEVVGEKVQAGIMHFSQYSVVTAPEPEDDTGDGKKNKSDANNTGLIIGIVAGSVALIALVAVIVWYKRRPGGGHGGGRDGDHHRGGRRHGQQTYEEPRTPAQVALVDMSFNSLNRTPHSVEDAPTPTAPALPAPPANDAMYSRDVIPVGREVAMSTTGVPTGVPMGIPFDPTRSQASVANRYSHTETAPRGGGGVRHGHARSPQGPSRDRRGDSAYA